MSKKNNIIITLLSCCHWNLLFAIKNISLTQRENKQKLVTVSRLMKSEKTIINGAKRNNGDDRKQATCFQAQRAASDSTRLVVSGTTHATPRRQQFRHQLITDRNVLNLLRQKQQALGISVCVGSFALCRNVGTVHKHMSIKYTATDDNMMSELQ